MKWGYHRHADAGRCVRPLAGAGIEIYIRDTNTAPLIVRPLAGAGIEITKDLSNLTTKQVRPLAGAGIEIQVSRDLKLVARGSPPHGGGN